MLGDTFWNMLESSHFMLPLRRPTIWAWGGDKTKGLSGGQDRTLVCWSVWEKQRSDSACSYMGHSTVQNSKELGEDEEAYSGHSMERTRGMLGLLSRDRLPTPLFSRADRQMGERAQSQLSRDDHGLSSFLRFTTGMPNLRPVAQLEC